MLTTALKNLLLATLPTIILLVLLGELFFRYIVPACEIPYVYFDRNDQILRYDVNSSNKGLYTIGRFAEQRAKWRINNHGWNSNVDYASYQERDKPLIAIIGDSYIEAFQANVDQNIAAVLRSLVNNNYDVFSFGISGAPLSQYLQMARYVNRHFRPEVIVFNLVHNDFDESIRELHDQPYFLQVGFMHEGVHELPIYSYKPNVIRRIFGKSALIRYLYLNLRVHIQINKLIRSFNSEENDGNFQGKNGSNVAKPESHRELVRKATFFLVKKIRDENSNAKLVFMIDAPRPDIYSGTKLGSDLLWMHEILEEACHQNSCYFIDLTSPFAKIFDQEGLKFNSDYDPHWNEIGHKMAAQVLYERLIEFSIVPR